MSNATAPPPTITEFLAARLLEREHRYNSTEELDLTEDAESARGPGWFEGECMFPGCDWRTTGREPVVEDAFYEHLNFAHDRKWVWADIAAKRAILAAHQRHEERTAFALALDLSPAHPDQRRDATWEVLRLLASADSDHLDYQQEWKP